MTFHMASRSRDPSASTVHLYGVLLGQRQRRRIASTARRQNSGAVSKSSIASACLDAAAVHSGQFSGANLQLVSAGAGAPPHVE